MFAWIGEQWRRWLGTVSRLLVATAATLGTVYLTLSGATVIKGNHSVEVAAIILDGAVSIGAAGRLAYLELRAPNVQRREVSVRQALEAAWVAVADKTGISMVDLMVSYFALEGAGQLQRLHRRLRVGVKQIPRSTVWWSKDKGVVGHCWETEATVRQNLSSLNRDYGTCSEAAWNALPSGRKMGMSYSDWRKTRRKYDMVIAVPIHDDDRFLGCVALTGPTHNSTWIEQPDVEQALVAAAATIAMAT